MTVRSCFTIVAAAALSLLPAIAAATNGYFTHGVGTKEKGLAGAGVALSQDMLAAANNPAGMAVQGGGYDIGLALFNPNRSYSADGIAAPAGTAFADIPGCLDQACPFSIGDGDQSLDSDSTLFGIPQFGYNWVLDDTRSVGVSVYGNGGMNTDYRGGVATLPAPTDFGGNDTMVEFPGTFGDGNAGVNLAQLFVSTTYAQQVTPAWRWGASLLLAYQQFEAKGLGNFAGFSTDPQNLTNNGTDAATGIGVRLGVQGEIAPGVSLGAAYQPEIDMSEFDDYSGLFAEDGDFDIPSNLTVGVAWEFKPGNTVLFDIQMINYEDVPSVSNPIAPLTPDGSCNPQAGPGFSGAGAGCLGGSDGAGFGWENVTVYKLGYQLEAGNGYTWRFGFSTLEQPIPASEQLFNVLAPGVVEQHYTFGLSKVTQGGGEFNFAAMLAPSNSVSGTNTFDPAQTIENEMDQIELTFGYARRF